MNAIFLESSEDLTGDLVSSHLVSSKDTYILTHLHSVIKPAIGDQLKVIVKDQGLYLAELISLSAEEVKLEIKKALKKVEPWIDLVIGVSRPQTTKKILEHGTTYGVKSFHFFMAELSEKSYLTSKVLTSEEGQELLKLGLSQSARYYKLPQVKTSLFNPANQYKDFDFKFILEFEEAKRFTEIPLPDLSGGKQAKIVLAIGPERGFRTNDINRFIEAGFQKVTISEAVLRVEHALYSSLAQLELLTKKY